MSFRRGSTCPLTEGMLTAIKVAPHKGKHVAVDWFFRLLAESHGATVRLRIGRRMQVNRVENLGGYVACLRTHSGECTALLQDLLISVTHFFRDQKAFAADPQLAPVTLPRPALGAGDSSVLKSERGDRRDRGELHLNSSSGFPHRRWW